MVRMSRVAVVTGANQGLGFALAEGLAQRMAADGIVYLTGRSGDRLRDAATRLTAPVADVHTHVLDVRDGAAVAAFADELRGPSRRGRHRLLQRRRPADPGSAVG